MFRKSLPDFERPKAGVCRPNLSQKLSHLPTQFTTQIDGGVHKCSTDTNRSFVVQAVHATPGRCVNERAAVTSMAAPRTHLIGYLTRYCTRTFSLYVTFSLLERTSTVDTVLFPLLELSDSVVELVSVSLAVMVAFILTFPNTCARNPLS